MSKDIAIIGSGFSSLAAACYLAKQGNDVTVYEKNSAIGGRARQLKKEGFTFDIGPTWYWMPDVFERFFADFGKKPSDYYELIKLSPAYQVYFGHLDFVTIADNLPEIVKTFESIEKGSGKQLEQFMAEAKSNYDIAIKDLVYRPGESPLELITLETAKKVNQFFSNIKKDVRKRFKNMKLVQILEFPVLFLGAKPSDTPSFYNFMNFADFGLGTWHPKNGMYSVILAMETLAKELGVKIETNSNVEKIDVTNGKATGLLVNNKIITADITLSGADYHHSETLLDEKYRQYSEKYWENKTFAPSSLLFYVGFDKKIENVEHHSLFFDVDFDIHAEAIYDNPKWPEEPLFYASFPSKTDENSAPEGKEAGIFLIPLAPGLEDTNELRELYFEKIITRLERLTNQSVKNNIIFKESFCVNDFVKEYNSYKGNAYGMANTLLQTAFLRPKLKSKKVQNLYFTGQLTVPGPGVPPSLISGKLVADLIKSINSMKSIFDNVSFDCSVKVTKAYSTSFSSAVKMLAPSIRQDIYNIYGFVRFADEIVDTFHDYDKEALFSQFENELSLALSQRISLNPILNSFQHTVNKYNIPQEMIDAFMKSMKLDLSKSEYKTTEEYKEYIYGSADVVGLMCLKVFVNGNDEKYNELKDSAMRLGSAFQKVNFLRDLKADYEELSRTYFPNTDLNHLDEKSKQEIIADIESDFEAAYEGIKNLPLEAKFGVYTAYRYYKKLLKKLQKTPSLEIKNTRIRVSDYQKVELLARCYVKYRLNII